VDDLHIARIARALRRRLGLRQTDVAERAGCSQGEVSLVERARIESMSLRRLRKLFAVFDAELVVSIRWRGGDLDRLIDARHAALAKATTTQLERAGWTIAPEVSYSIYGERGSIDLLAWHEATCTLLVVELKTEIASIEETLRRHDVKTRLGPAIARERFGWAADAVGRLLVLPDDRTARRRVDQHRALFDRAYPLRTIAVRQWLRSPAGAIGGIVFAVATLGRTGLRRIRPAPVERPHSTGNGRIGDTRRERQTNPAPASRAATLEGGAHPWPR
jgi:transcriptional regulator with XRE-family HTH domain